MAYFPGLSLFGDRQSSNSLVFEEFVPPSAWTEDSTCHYLLVDLPGFKKQEIKLQVDNQTHILVTGERQVRENKYKRFEQRFELPNNADVEKTTGKLDGEILYISVPKKPQQAHKETSHSSIAAPAPTPVSDDNDNDNNNNSNDNEQNDDNDNDNDNDDDNEDDEEKKSDVYETDDGQDGRTSAPDQEHGDEKKLSESVKDHGRRKYKRIFDDKWGQDAEFVMRFAIEKLKNNKEIVVTAIVAFSLGVLVTQKLQSNGN